MTNNPTPETAPAADLLVSEARAAVHESLIFLAAPEADRVRALIADLETAVEGRTAIRFAAATVPAPAPTDFELRGTGEIRATALIEAADFLRNAHFGEGLTVQEIGTALRHWADRERAEVAPVSGPGGVAGETRQPETQAVERPPRVDWSQREQKMRAEAEAGFTDFDWAVGKVICPAREKCPSGLRGIFTPLTNGRLPMHRHWLGEPCEGARQKPTTPPLRLRPAAVSQPGKEAETAHACTEFGTWFDRNVCPDPCGAMHQRCDACGAAIGGCRNEAAS